MSWEDKDLKKNYKGEMVPQAYDPDIDDYAVVKSIMGALRFVPYGPDGQPLNVSGGKLQIRSAELEALLQGFATDTELQAVKSKLDDLEGKLNAIMTILTDGSQKVLPIPRLKSIYSMELDDRPDFEEVTQPTLFVLMNAEMDMWWTDGSAEWVKL